MYKEYGHRLAPGPLVEASVRIDRLEERLNEDDAVAETEPAESGRADDDPSSGAGAEAGD